MFDLKIVLVFAVVSFAWPCLTEKVREKIICSHQSYVDCRRRGMADLYIHVVDVIYGRVVGLSTANSKCGIRPKVNCTAPAYCEVAERSNRRAASNWLYIGNLKHDPCPGEVKYLIIKYRCLDWKETSLVGLNFAHNKPTSQSQTRFNGIPSKAVDGDTINRDYSFCTRTAVETNPWWRVDLQQPIAVSHVRVFNRYSSGIILCGFEIRIGDSIENNGTTNARCGTLRHIPSNKHDVISCELPLVGRYVTIVIPGKNKVLSLCEVQVYGTPWPVVAAKSELFDGGWSKTILYVVIPILLVTIAVLVVVVICVICVCLRRRKPQPPGVKDTVVNVENKSFSDGIYENVENPDADSNMGNIDSSTYEALDLSETGKDTYQSLVKPTV